MKVHDVTVGHRDAPSLCVKIENKVLNHQHTVKNSKEI